MQSKKASSSIKIGDRVEHSYFGECEVVEDCGDGNFSLLTTKHGKMLDEVPRIRFKLIRDDVQRFSHFVEPDCPTREEIRLWIFDDGWQKLANRLLWIMDLENCAMLSFLVDWERLKAKPDKHGEWFFCSERSMRSKMRCMSAKSCRRIIKSLADLRYLTVCRGYEHGLRPSNRRWFRINYLRIKRAYDEAFKRHCDQQDREFQAACEDADW